ncbi:hypothetical protein BJX99DRAFT_241305 [Aspergillus californicus]
MAVDAMDIDSNPIPAGQAESEKERKRKHKRKDESAASPSKKKRKHEKAEDADKKSKKKKDKSSKTKDKTKPDTTPTQQREQDTVTPASPYSLTTATLYLPLSPISISPTHALASLLAEHLSPLLLTYFPPLRGIVLAYSNASISSFPPSPQTSTSTDPRPQPLTLAATAGEYGVMYVYLTATFLVFRPQRGQVLEGWVNVQSEGFLGAVVLNLFSVGIERKRLPTSWKWIPPGEEGDAETGGNPSSAPTSEDEDEDNTSPPFNPEKERFNPIVLASDANPFSYDYLDQDPLTSTADPETQGEGEDADESYEGYFRSVSGHHVRGTVKFRVVDIDVIPGTERDRSFISLEGTMLSPEEENQLIEDEKNGIIAPSSTLRKATIPLSASVATMSGAIGVEADNEAVDVKLDDHEYVEETPSKKPKKGKSTAR